MFIEEAPLTLPRWEFMLLSLPESNRRLSHLYVTQKKKI